MTGFMLRGLPARTWWNVDFYEPGLDTSSGWTRISGFSERVVDWIALTEKSEGPRLRDHPKIFGVIRAGRSDLRISPNNH